MSYKDKLDNINGICFFPRDFERAREFFEGIWGFKPRRVQPPSPETGGKVNYVDYSFRGAVIVLWDREEVSRILGADVVGEAHNYMTAVRLNRVDDIDEVYEEFTAKGVTCISKPETFSFGSRAAYFLDCEKNIWELFAWCEGGEGPALIDRDGNPVGAN